jgi:sodium transport system permease protein
LEVEVSSDVLDEAAARERTAGGKHDVVISFPPGFAARMREEKKLLAERPAEAPATVDADAKKFAADVYWNEAKEKSKIGYARVMDVLLRWREEAVASNLTASHLPPTAARPFWIQSEDVSPPQQRSAATWARVLPFVLLIWALTGAFYPAVDLCAGEKERGTLETLLSSPAERTEIVWGKLLTIMIFSMVTSLLNLISMGITGSLVLSQAMSQGPPPISAIIWLLVALPPVAALFSALCLALAAFARSTKEGQYYLMPLVLGVMPLTILPMAPGVELNLGYSLIPVTGVVLLLRTMLEGNYAVAAPFIVPVAGVTLVCCHFAIRWATDQFNSESVLFRESERLDLGLWLKQLVEKREGTPSPAEAVFCGVLILLLEFFVNLRLAQGSTDNVALYTVGLQLGVVAAPALIMTVMLTNSAQATLLLRWPRWQMVLAAILLAVTLHPAASALRAVVMRVYPVNEHVAEKLAGLTKNMSQLWLLLLWLIPPLCEELTFRGFILSGLQRMGRPWRAIIISSLFFGATHTILQQSLIATVFGTVLAYLAVQSGSLLPSLLFHLIHNGLSLFVDERLCDKKTIEDLSLGWLIDLDSSWEQLYRWPVVAVGVLIAGGVIWWLKHLPPVAAIQSQSADESAAALDISPERSPHLPVG